MTDRIYVTYKPTIVPETYHVEINYERRDAYGNMISHRIIDAGPANRRLSDKSIGASEEKLSAGGASTRFGNIVATERDPEEEDKNLAYETIAEGSDLSSNWARMQPFAHGVNRAGFAYRGDHQNSNSFGGALLQAGGLSPATGVAHDPAGPPGELLEFFLPGLNEPLRDPLGRHSNHWPVDGVHYASNTVDDGDVPKDDPHVMRVAFHTIFDRAVSSDRNGPAVFETAAATSILGKRNRYLARRIDDRPPATALDTGAPSAPDRGVSFGNRFGQWTSAPAAAPGRNSDPPTPTFAPLRPPESLGGPSVPPWLDRGLLRDMPDLSQASGDDRPNLFGGIFRADAPPPTPQPQPRQSAAALIMDHIRYLNALDAGQLQASAVGTPSAPAVPAIDPASPGGLAGWIAALAGADPENPSQRASGPKVRQLRGFVRDDPAQQWLLQRPR